MKEVVKHIWLNSECNDPEYGIGWYFEDETAGLNGPFET